VAGRIVLFGATGYTGRLAAEAMLERGMSPLLAARNAERLNSLAGELGGDLETAVADVSDPSGIAALLDRGDVIVSTVGPFLRYGQAAVTAATTAGAHYIDSTGEPPFIREIFERHDAAARKNGSALVTAFGYDFVPGNLVGALALREAGDRAVRVDVGYYNTGRAEASGGTQASLVGVMLEPAFAWRDGRIQTERSAKRYRTFEVNGRDRPGVSVGASEHFGLPRVAPQLREVNSYLGWFGPGSRPMQGLSAAGSVAVKLPGVAKLWDSLGSRLAKGSTGGPDAEARARSGSHIVGAAYDAAGKQLSEVHLTGIDGYTFTGRSLAWGAEHAAAGGLRDVGALGPVDGFGLDELRQGCEEAGLHAEGGEARAAAPDRAGESAPLA
jgi:short subunit dehydrogenase-like uncharacterized protein